jgi:drug/metabolite transporter (DMT)-like permease
MSFINKMLSVGSVKGSIKVYLRTREIVLHPCFFILQVRATQLFTAFWIVFKKQSLASHKVNTVSLTQFFFEFLIDLGASFMLVAVSLLFLGKDRLLDIPRKHWRNLMWSGVFGVSFAQTFFCLGLGNSQAAETCVGMLMVPICVFLLGIVMGLERPTVCKVNSSAVSWHHAGYVRGELHDDHCHAVQDR